MRVNNFTAAFSVQRRFRMLMDWVLPSSITYPVLVATIVSVAVWWWTLGKVGVGTDSLISRLLYISVPAVVVYTVHAQKAPDNKSPAQWGRSHLRFFTSGRARRVVGTRVSSRDFAPRRVHTSVVIEAGTQEERP